MLNLYNQMAAGKSLDVEMQDLVERGVLIDAAQPLHAQEYSH